MLKSGYGFDCNCEVGSLPFNLLEQDDKLRVEAFNLSQTCFDLKDSLSSEEMSNVLGTAERWFFLRKMLGYKVGYKVYNIIQKNQLSNLNIYCLFKLFSTEPV